MHLCVLLPGSVHTHVLAWKADLDIAGTENSLNILEFKVWWVYVHHAHLH